MAPTFSGSHRDTADWVSDITQFSGVASMVVNIAGVLCVLSAGFLIYAITSGKAAQVSQTGNMNTAAALLNLCAVAAAVGLIISQWEARAVGIGLAIAGMAFLAGVPPFLPTQVQSIASLFQGGGFFLLVLGLGKFVLDMALGSSSRRSTTVRGHAPGPTQAVLMPSAPGQAAPSGNVIGVQIVTVPGAPTAGVPAAGAPLSGQHAPQQPGRPSGAHIMPQAPGQHAGTLAPETEIIDDVDQIGVMRRAMETLDPIANWVFRVAAVGGAASLAYLLFAIFGGRIGQVAVSAAVAHNVKLAAGVLHWSLIFLAISGVWLAMDISYLGLAMIGVGVGLHIGAPWFLGTIGKTELLGAVAATLRATGFAVAVVGVLKQLYETVRWAMDLPNRMKQKADVGVAQEAEPAQRRVAREANMFSPCWKLPFCREVIRKQCPAFLANKTCWKFGRGCYCDEEMISRIIRGESLDVIKAPTRLSRTGKPPCERCHIYLEHQGFKFKMLSPLALPATIVFMYFIWPMYSRLFMAFSTSKVWDALSFDTSKVAPDAIKTDPSNLNTATLNNDQVAQYATILIGVLLGFFVFVYISKFIEWAIYKAKL